jgi:hypothetical protein
MRILVIVGLCLAMGGCPWYDGARQIKSNADIAEDRAAIMKLYRGCLEKYQDDPAKAKANCEHYTQALHSVDVRGMK